MKNRVLAAWLTAAIIGLGACATLDAAGAMSAAGIDEAAGAVSAGGVKDDARSIAKAQVEFGIEVARKELWREAAYRFEKAVETDPTYAAAWNNLAIAYEQQGNFNDANKAYTKAVELEPNNMLIRQNYDLFKEIYDRLSRRRR